MERGREPKSKKQRHQEAQRRSAAMARVFNANDASREDCMLVQANLQRICKVNDRTSLGGIEGLLALVQRDAKREVFLDIMDGINTGREVISDGGVTTVADSGETHEH